ncbi:MAG: alpha/beta hydrolase [Planctomycetaceae bacterium]|nr:MAG: alpha/beta hydrolase [Planctomycetaceae bacterium]
MIVKRKYFKIVGVIILLLTFLFGAVFVSPLCAKEVGDINIDYRISGTGYPLVMIMGYSGTMDMWDPTMLRILSSRYKVIIFDNRGMGGTDAGDCQFTIEQFADDTAGLMDALGIQNAHVLGWSMGTDIAQELVLRHPEKVNKLILYAADCGTDVVPIDPDVVKKMSDTSGTLKKRGRRLLPLLFPRDWLKNNVTYLKKLFSRPMKMSSPENIKRQYSAIENWKGSCGRLDQIKSQTLLITGTEDVVTPPENSSKMVKGIPGAKLASFENSGHGRMNK